MNDAADKLQRYRQLIEISRDLASTLDLDILLGRIAQAAVDFSDSEAGSILLYDGAKKEIRFMLATNIQSSGLMLGIVVPMDSLAGWVAENREPVIVADVHKDKRWFGNVEKQLDFPTRSIIAIPMIANDKVIGVLEALNKRVGTFTEQDQEMLMVLGAQAAVAIENTRLFKQSDLIAELVHELRTPLSSISTVAYLLQRPDVAAQQRISLAQTIHQEAQRLNELATNFLDLARLESGRATVQISAFDVTGLLKECCDITRPRAEESSLQINVMTASQLPRLEADRDKIKQVILNLLSNAIKYNRPGGEINVGATTDGDSMLISVMDTGLGMSKEDVSHLFERFFRAQSSESLASGTGLGLSICKRIIDSHRGEIGVESEAGVGTKFTVSIPLKPL